MQVDVVQADFGLTLLLFAATFVLSTLLTKKPKQEQARPSGLGDFNFPTTTEGRSVPLIWGTVKLDGPNVVWYGDLRQIPITERVKTGMFSKKTVTTGFKYNVGIQFAFCRGPIDSVLRVWIGDKIAFSGSQGAGAININEPTILGGDEFGAGGVIGTLRMFIGDETQVASSYLAPFQQQGGDTPAYRGTCYGVWEQGYIGNSSSIQPWAIEARRITNGLILTGGDELVNGNDANPMNVAYELFTDDDWGYNFPASDIDIPNFRAAATTLAAEGNGFSMVLDKPLESEEFLKEIERQIDGIFYFNRSLAKWQVTLARPGQASKGTADETNVIKVTNFSRASWEETSNQVRVNFNDRSRDYFGTGALAQDTANVRILGSNVPVDLSFPGVKDADLANEIAWRNQRTLSFPLAKVELMLDRNFFDLNPGDIIEWSDAILGIVSLDMRIIKVALGQLVGGQITISAVQDIFSSDPASFVKPQPTGWVPPTDTVVDIPAADRIVFESPKAISDRDPIKPSVANRIWAGARYQGDNAIQFDVVGDGAIEGTTVGFLLAGKLFSAVTRDSTAAIILKPDPDSQADMLAAFETITNEDKGVALAQLVIINGEFISITSAAASGLNVQLNTPTRGMLDTTPAEHAIDDPCYLMFVNGNLTDGTFTTTPVDTELLPESPTDKLLVGDAANFDIAMANRDLKPYPPVRPLIAGTEYDDGVPTPISLDTAVGATDDGLGYTVDFTRRDFRTEDEYLAQLDETTLPADFPSNNTTEYRIEVFDDPAGSLSSLFTTAWTTGDGTAFAIGRTEILAANAGVVPTNMRIEVQTRHIFDGETTEREAGQVLQWDFVVDSAELDPGDQVLGVAANGVSLTAYTAATTGNYTLSLGANILVNGTLEENVNGGGFVATPISAGTSTTVRAYTAADSVVFRINGETPAISLDTILKVDDQAIGDTSDGHGVFTL